METVKTLSAKVEDLQEKIDLILKKLEGMEVKKIEEKEVVTITYIRGWNKGIISDLFNEKDIIEKTKEITDEYDNTYICLPPLYIRIEEEKADLSFYPLKGGIELRPQMISKYKNSLINGQCRSIPGVIPDFNEMSFEKSEKFVEWADGEMMNWKTQLYIQLVFFATYGLDNSLLKEEAYCGDTGRGIGEFLGIEQLFCFGYNFISFKDFHQREELEFLYKSVNNRDSITTIIDEDGNIDGYGLWGWSSTDHYYLPIFNIYYIHKDEESISKTYFPRLCKAPR